MKNSKSKVLTKILQWWGVLLLATSLSYNFYQTIYFEKVCHHFGIDVNYKIRPSWDQKSINAWTNTIKDLNDSFDICFFGHSQIQHGNFQEHFSGYKTINIGFVGNNIEQLILRKEQIKYTHPKKIIVLCGVNSLNYSLNKFERKYKELLDGIREENPTSKIFIINILPTASKDNVQKIIDRNKIINNYAFKQKIKLIDAYSYFSNEENLIDKIFTVDTVHLNKLGYEKLCSLIKESTLN